MNPVEKFWRGAMQCDVVQSTKFVKFCTFNQGQMLAAGENFEKLFIFN